LAYFAEISQEIDGQHLDKLRGYAVKVTAIKEDMLINEAIEKFNYWRGFKTSEVSNTTYAQILRQFCVFMRNCDVRLIKLEDILQWFEIMTTLGYDRNSFIPRAIALRKLFEYLSKTSVPVLDPWLIPVPNKTYRLPRVVSEEHYSKLIAVIPKKTNDPRHIRNLAIVQMLWDTGARNGELCKLDIGEVNLVEKKAVINTEKNRGSRPFREIFWTDETNKSLERWIDKRSNLEKIVELTEPNALFISIMSEKSGCRFTSKGLGEMLRRYSNRAKIPTMRTTVGTNAHAFRHHKAHQILKSGGTSADVMNILGHATLASGSVYQSMYGTELEERYRRLFGE